MSMKLAGGWVFSALLLTPALAPAQVSREHPPETKPPVAAAPDRSAGRPDLARVERLIVQMTNRFRQQQGRGRLRVNAQLTQTARKFADYLARTGKFSHTADGRQPWDRTAAEGYPGCIVAENIAWEYNPAGFSTYALANALVTGWEKSPGHRKNLLDPDLDEIGVAVAYSEKTGRYYAVQDFGRPRSEQIVFTITNHAGAAVGYTVDGKSFTIQPRYTVTHSQCRPPTLTLRLPQGSAKGVTSHPHNGSHLILRSDSAGKVTVEEQ